MRIYFAGKVPKGHDSAGQLDWRSELASALNHETSNIDIVSPENPNLDESDSLAVFGHDCLLIRGADLVVVNADQKLGVGTAQEMLIAKYFGKPVLTILPRDTHHRRTDLMMFGNVIRDWKHPFIVATSDAVFDSVDDLKSFLSSDSSGRLSTSIKDIGIIDLAIEHYEARYSDGQ